MAYGGDSGHYRIVPGLNCGVIQSMTTFQKFSSALFCTVFFFAAARLPAGEASAVREDENEIRIVTPELEATVRRKGYVTGIAAGSLLDKKTGSRDLGYGLDIVDWIMEAGSDEAYRDKLSGDLLYEFGNAWHGKRAKRSLEGPQICTKARELSPTVLQNKEGGGRDFVAVQMSFRYTIAAPGHTAGSTWSQNIVFPAGKRYFISSDRISSVNSSDEMFLRLDMPGHIKHKEGDAFSEIYLSYAVNAPGDGKTPVGKIPSSEFKSNFAPDEKYNYRRDTNPIPKRFIRAYHLRDPKTGQAGPWLAGMTLNPADVYEAWCHQRGYVCFIEEIGGRPVKAGSAGAGAGSESFGAAYIVGYFDSIEEMEAVYDLYSGKSMLDVTAEGWKLK